MARRRLLARRRTDVVDLETSTTSSATEERSAPTLKLPFDPLRLLDVLIRHWWLMLLAGLIGGTALFMLGRTRFETLHTATAKIIKQEASSSFRQSETGETFKPRDFSIPTFISLMYSSGTIEAASQHMQPTTPEQQLRSGLVIAPEKHTDVVSISMTSDQSPETALHMLQGFTAEALRLARDLQRGDATEMRRFLELEIKRTDADLVKANEEILEYARREKLVNADKQMDAWLGQLSNLTLKYEGLKLDHETLDLRIQSTEKELAKVDTSAARLDNARREVAELSVRYTDEHPAMQEAREKLTTLEQQLKSSGPRADAPPKPGESAVAESLYLELVRLRSEKKVMTEQLTKLDAVRQELNNRLSELPRKAMEYARIKSKQQTLEASRALLASRQREAVLFEENAQGYFKLFSMDRLQDVDCVPPTQKLALVTAAGFAGGAGAVAFCLSLLTLLDGRMRTAGDLKRATGVPVIGMHSNNQTEDEATWAFKTWTRLQPTLIVPARGGAAICGLMHQADPATADSMTLKLAGAAALRGLTTLVITSQAEVSSLSLTEALQEPEKLSHILHTKRGDICHLHTDSDWTWTAAQLQQWTHALSAWRTLNGLVILITLPSAEKPEALMLAERLPNLLWVGTSGQLHTNRVSDTLKIYRDAGCRLVASLLANAPVLRPAALARLALPVLLLLAFQPSLHAAEPAAPLRLGAGDAVNISMPNLEGHERSEITIGPDGRLTYLQARDIQAAGLTIDQLREALTTQLSRYYRNAKVVVTPFTFQSRKVYVLGKVVKKGAINLERPLTVLEVVAEAGGLETGLFQQNTVELADLGRSFLMRGNNRMPVNLEALFLRGDMSQNIRVEPGDYLYFPSANSNEIYVLGDVKMQGTQGLLAHTSVHSAIAQAGGFTPRAYTKRVLVIRGSLEAPQRFVVNMDDILTARSQGFKLEPKDIVYIADRPWARAEELLNIAINAFLQGAVSSWTRANVGPFIQQTVLPQIR